MRASPRSAAPIGLKVDPAVMLSGSSAATEAPAMLRMSCPDAWATRGSVQVSVTVVCITTRREGT